MRWIAAIVVLSSVLAGSARADETARERELAAALVKGDVATLQAAAAFPFYVYGLWFDSAPCKKFGGARYALVSEAEFPELVACLVALEPRLHPNPYAGMILYGAGSPATVRVQTDHGKTRMRAFMGASPKQLEGDAPPIDSAELYPRTARYTVVVPPALTRTIDASPTMVAKANFRVCFDAKGKVDLVKLLDVGPDVPAYARIAEKAIRRWKVKPFKLRGKPLRACGTIFTAYPGERVGDADRVQDPDYPPVPAPP